MPAQRTGDDPSMKDKLAAFLEVYRAVCAEEGVEPLPEDELAVLAEALLTGPIPALVTLH